MCYTKSITNLNHSTPSCHLSNTPFSITPTLLLPTCQWHNYWYKGKKISDTNAIYKNKNIFLQKINKLK